jgi:hypothetical protein
MHTTVNVIERRPCSGSAMPWNPPHSWYIVSGEETLYLTIGQAVPPPLNNRAAFSAVLAAARKTKVYQELLNCAQKMP